MKRMYIRVSKAEQNTDRQKELIKKYNPDVVYEEKVSGVNKRRNELDKLLNEIQSGDIVYVESFSRIARNMKQLLSIVEKFENNNVSLVSEKEDIKTNTASGKLMFHIFAALSQFERDLLIERINEGKAVSNKKGGRPKIDNDKLNIAMNLYDTGKYTVDGICNQLNISRATFYREKNKRSDK
jgi:DNA invertase Pin-like site-specific DNA recombinase